MIVPRCPGCSTSGDRRITRRATDTRLESLNVTSSATAARSKRPSTSQSSAAMRCALSLLAAALCAFVSGAAGSDDRCSCTPRAIQCNGRNMTQLRDEDLCEYQVSEWSLNHNELTHLHFLPSPCYVVMLDVSYNNIRTLGHQLKTCEKLLLLLLSFNPLSSLPSAAFQGMTNLAYLELERTSLSQLREETFAGLPALYSLNLGGNKLTELPEKLFSGLASLNFLDISRNQINNLPHELFHGLTQLRVVNASENRLVQLQPGLFSSSPQLLALLVSGNQLVHLEDELFSGLFELRRLEAQRNQLKQIPVLQECCAHMSFADFSRNNISAPSVNAVKALLHVSHRLETQMRRNPVSRGALCEVLRAGGIKKCASGGRCLCGRLRPCRESQKCWSFVEFCEGACKTEYEDWFWMDAANADDSLLELE